MPKVSIITPCYRQAEFLAETLESIEKQSFTDWECIIVNDGSPDSTEEVANLFCDKDKRFTYLFQDNQGVAMARNNGISRSTGEYILPLDADDRIDTTFLEKTVKWMESHPDCKLVYTRVKAFGSSERELRFPEFEYDSFIWDNCITNTCLFRRKDFDATQGYNPNIKNGLEDWDFLLSLIKRGDSVHRINETLFRYRFKPESRNTVINSAQSKKPLFQQLVNNHPDVYKPFSDNLMLLGRRAFRSLPLPGRISNGKLFRALMNLYYSRKPERKFYLD